MIYNMYFVSVLKGLEKHALCPLAVRGFSAIRGSLMFRQTANTRDKLNVCFLSMDNASVFVVCVCKSGVHVVTERGQRLISIHNAMLTVDKSD
jgi:hypothetical protein